LGWFTKKPVQAVVREMMASAAEKNSFHFKFRIIIDPLKSPKPPESAYEIVAEQNYARTYPVPTCDTAAFGSGTAFTGELAGNYRSE